MGHGREAGLTSSTLVFLLCSEYGERGGGCQLFRCVVSFCHPRADSCKLVYSKIIFRYSFPMCNPSQRISQFLVLPQLLPVTFNSSPAIYITLIQLILALFHFGPRISPFLSQTWQRAHLLQRQARTRRLEIRDEASMPTSRDQRSDYEHRRMATIFEVALFRYHV